LVGFVTEQTGVDEVLRSRGGRLLRAVAATVASAVPVALLAFAVRQEFDPVITADNAAIRAATTFSRTRELTSSLVMLQQVTQPVVVYSAGTVGVIWLGLTKGLRGRALWAFVTMMTGWAIGGAAKVLVQRVRPMVDDPLSHSPGYSFPSGHALNIAIAGSAMVVLMWPLLRRTGRRLAVGGAVVAGFAVGLDRILLGVHFPSDVVAGWLLGLGITATSWIGFTGVTSAPTLARTVAGGVSLRRRSLCRGVAKAALHHRGMPKAGNVVLLTGPAASGKSTLAQYLAQQLGWQAVSEDDYWVRNGWGSGPRSPEQEATVQQQVVGDLLPICWSGRSVVLEFILYSEPPKPLSAYEAVLTDHAVAFEVIALKPSVAEILRRMAARGRPRDTDQLSERRREAEHQTRILESDAVRLAPVIIDNTHLSVGATYHVCLERLGRLLS
jgi:undecaprenyl-diphosphatase